MGATPETKSAAGKADDGACCGKCGCRSECACNCHQMCSSFEDKLKNGCGHVAAKLGKSPAVAIAVTLVAGFLLGQIFHRR